MSAESVDPVDMEVFILENGISDAAADELRACEPEVWAAVLGEGSLQDSPDPEAEVMARIWKARGRVDGFSWGDGGSDADQDGGSGGALAEEEVLSWCLANGVDDKSTGLLLEAEPEVQAKVLGHGDLVDARNPSAMLISRVRQSRQDLGMNGKGSGRSGAKANDAAASAESGARAAEAGPPPTEEEVEAFIMESGLDEAAAGALKGADPEIQRAVIDRGDLSDARNPSSMLLSRLRQSRQDLGNNDRGGGRSGAKAHGTSAESGGVPPESGQPATEEEVEAFILDNALDEAAVDALKGADPQIQRAVIDRGDLFTARYPSKALLGRLRDARKAVKEREPSGPPKNIAGGSHFATLERSGFVGASRGSSKVGWTPTLGPGAAGAAIPMVRSTPLGGGVGLYGGGRARQGYGMAPPSADMHSGGGGGRGYEAQASGGGSLGSPGEPGVLWLGLGRECSLVQQGFPGRVAVCEYQKGDTIFSSSAYLLSDIFGDALDGEVSLVHDDNWKLFPEIAKAIKLASGDEHCIAVATCPNLGKWAIGCANGWKGRESAARVALAVALCAEDPTLKSRLTMQYPQFRMLWKSVDLAKGAGGGAASGGRAFGGGACGARAGYGGGCGYGGCGTGGASGGASGAGGAGRVLATPLAAQRGGYGGGGCRGGIVRGGAGAAPQGAQLRYRPQDPPEETGFVDMGGLPTPDPSVYAPAAHWLTVPAESRLVQAGFADTGPCITYSKAMSEFFGTAHSILGELVEPTDVVIDDDPDWKVFPEVGRAAKQVGAEENCYAVASCASHGVWAVGMGAGWKARESAVRLALALPVARAAGRLEELCSKYGELGAVCAAAGLSQQLQQPLSNRRHR